MRRHSKYLLWLTYGLLLSGVVTVSGQETNWGKWGPKDEIGTLNYIRPDMIVGAAHLIRQGKVFSLGQPMEDGHPRGTGRTGRVYRYMMSLPDGDPRTPGLAEDHFFAPVHGTTHWDGLAHVYGEGTMYNGYGAEEWVDDRGARKLGIHHMVEKVVGRGVLIDVARSKGVRHLPRSYTITRADVEEALQRQGTEVRRGDIILFHSGWMMVWYEEGREAWRNAPGIGWEVTQWLKEREVAAVGSDGIDTEVQPADREAAERIGQPEWSYPVHYELLRNQGMLHGDLFSLHDLAEDCAADGVYEFLFAGPPLNLVNGTGSPVNPVAIK